MAETAHEISYRKDGLSINVDGQAASGLVGMSRNIYLARVKVPENSSDAEALAMIAVGPTVLFGSRGRITLGEIVYTLPEDAAKVPVIALFESTPETILAQWMEIVYRENPSWLSSFVPGTDDDAKKNLTESTLNSRKSSSRRRTKTTL